MIQKEKRKKSKGNIFEQNREFGKNRENEKKKEKKNPVNLKKRENEKIVMNLGKKYK